MRTALEYTADVLSTHDLLRETIHPPPVLEDLLAPQERVHVLRNTRAHMGQFDVLHGDLFPRHLRVYSSREDLESYTGREVRQAKRGFYYDWVVELLLGRADPASASASYMGTPNAYFEEATGLSCLCNGYFVSFDTRLQALRRH